MSQTRPWRKFFVRGVMSAAVPAVLLATVSADAQVPARPRDPNMVQVYLIRQDFSDCTNSNVPNVDSPSVSGNVWVVRQSNGNTSVKVALTATPNTTYHFFLKCVRQLGDISTDNEGVANVIFDFPTSSAGAVFAFDSYPEGAPAGNKFQSAQVKF